ncbi:hypothetical protein SAMN05216218_112117 [Halorientalis regularis]|uniref:Uncharacterized protein n=1 Tax=Halorientalis regularis TaxID=660518 RepID=A0A1G7QEU9_9EURY|nr:hypothetical protein SAMN05216218_112117 [Halorientalis regularis]
MAITHSSNSLPDVQGGLRVFFFEISGHWQAKVLLIFGQFEPPLNGQGFPNSASEWFGLSVVHFPI